MEVTKEIKVSATICTNNENHLLCAECRSLKFDRHDNFMICKLYSHRLVTYGAKTYERCAECLE